MSKKGQGTYNVLNHTHMHKLNTEQNMVSDLRKVHRIIKIQD